MKSKILHWLAILLILEVGIVHYISSQHVFEEAAVLGYLFIANFLGVLLAAYGIYRQKVWGWGLGLAIAAVSLGGYIWSRTLGLPGLEAETWLSAWGVTSLLAEGLFILLVLTRPWRSSQARIELSALPISLRYLWPAAALLALILVNYSTDRWQAVFAREDHGHDLPSEASVEAIKRAPAISLQDFEEQYGMQVSLVAVSAMNSIVDVRVKILDLEKAQALLEAHTALLVNDMLILPPHMHGHSVKEGKPYIVFYPNPQNIVKSGTPVSLVFGDLHLETVIAQ